MNSETKLFSPMRLGRHILSNRLVLAPLTRFRAADRSHVPLPFVKDYYVQRASTPGTLLITEGTLVAARGCGWSNAPGIWSHDQVAAWKQVVEGVHEAGGVVFMQLAASGRVADPAVLQEAGNFKVTGPSPIAADPQSGVEVHALSEEEIWEYVRDFAQAAKNAVEGAGFDGVEVHGANGYLIDQFTQDTANQRTDSWGGSIEKRSKFALEVVKAVVEAVGKEKVGYRISPFSDFQGMKMKDTTSQFTHLVSELKDLDLAYLHVVESRISGAMEGPGKESVYPFVQAWGNKSPVLLAGGFDPDSARRAVDEEYQNQDVAIVFGRHFLATPDLVYRVRHGLTLNAYDRNTFYAAKQREGYVDYPFSKEFLAERPSLLTYASAMA